MSFRGRLRLFFAIIVIVPMIAIGVVLFSLVASSENGKSDARIATSLTVAFSLYNDGRMRAQDDLERVTADPRLGRALRDGDQRAATARLRALARTDLEIVSATLRTAAGRLTRVGRREGIASAIANLRGAGGARLGTLAVSVTDGRALANSVRRRTGVALVIERNGRRVAASRNAPARVPDASGDFEAGGRAFRGRRQRVARGDTARLDLVAAVPRESLDSRVSKSRILIAAIVIVFILLALGGSLIVVRSLQAQIGQLLSAARRLASGDFDQPIPIYGSDEFAQLGREFNDMSDELRSKVEEVDRRRRQTEKTIRSVGVAFASGLDRQAVVELTVQTAVDACAAQVGHGLPLDLEVFDRVHAGNDDAAQAAVREEAERAAVALRPEVTRELTERRDPEASEAVEQLAAQRASGDGVHALAQPMLARLGTRTVAQLIGVISISRAGTPFTSAEADLLAYLAAQAVVSVENTDLHETVQRQAITDELTGLANVREMNARLGREFERAKRFDLSLAFMLLDIDDFKQINDTYGHQQGDRVIAELGALLRRMSREIDEPARYGGEELAVVLPQTDLDGAARLAERVRQAIESIRLPLAHGTPSHLSFTASFGVSSVSAGTSDIHSLVASADAALYRAKRAGKNRVERSDPPSSASS